MKCLLKLKKKKKDTGKKFFLKNEGPYFLTIKKNVAKELDMTAVAAFRARRRVKQQPQEEVFGAVLSCMRQRERRRGRQASRMLTLIKQKQQY